MMFKIQDEKGKVFNKVENPAVVYDRKTFTMIKIGERETMLEYHQFVEQTYRNAGFIEQAEDTTFMDLPPDQEIIDKVFQNTGYIEQLLKTI